MGSMLENLRTMVQPYGGDLFLLVAVLAIVSYAVLLYVKSRLDAGLLRRFLRVAALVALVGSYGAMQMGEQYFGAALLPLVWGIAVGVTCAREIQRKR